MQNQIFGAQPSSPVHRFAVKMILAFAIIAQMKQASAQATAGTTTYPRVAGYMSVVHPIVTFNKYEAAYNFSHGYTVGFPCGVNVLTSDRTGFSFELTPFIRSTNGVSKSSNFLFHPGVMFRYPKGFTLITRMAFETEGRYGATLVFNKIVVRSKTHNYFVAVPVPLRFGNDKPASIGVAFQFGITF